METNLEVRSAHSMTPTVVVLGVGNTLMQDDGVGVWAVRAFAEAYDLPPSIRPVDGGMAGLRWLSILDGAEHVIIVDAVIGNGVPGTVYHLEAGALPKPRGMLMSAHEIGITEVLSAAELLGMHPRIRIVGVQPDVYQQVGLELTPSVRAALPRVTSAIVEELSEIGIAVARKHRQEALDRHA
ncbi:MAG TPA: HyaD/HybD family hydrogenase maturation endopeptidase [Nitrospira sp.]|nr:HyaD/HybD family hydrogenase maturation endopeptidase [Nitrospira sp.]